MGSKDEQRSESGNRNYKGGSDFCMKYYIYLTSGERCEIMKSLIEYKNKLQTNGRHAAVMDDLLVKTAGALPYYRQNARKNGARSLFYFIVTSRVGFHSYLVKPVLQEHLEVCNGSKRNRR
jgi:hypothetical protein